MDKMESRIARMEEKIDKQTEDITQILVLAERSDERLDSMNGTILAHQKSLDCHRKKIRNIENNFNKYIGIGVGGMGAIGIFFTILQLFIL